MEDLQLLEAVERYIRGEMKPDERVYFEQLRKTNPEVDQLVVEHTLFVHKMNEMGERRNFKSTLSDVHTDLAEKGLINSDKLTGKARVVYLWRRYKRVATIAASIAGITTLTISLLVWSLGPKTPVSELEELNRKLNIVDKKTNDNDRKINSVEKKINAPATSNPPVIYTTGGTGFMVDAKGYLVTNAHVVRNAKTVVVQNRKGDNFNARVVYTDFVKDLVILKIEDDSFKTSANIPYAISKSSSDLAESIYTLGYPRNDEIVYNQGYLSARTGLNGDSLSCQITIAANPGNSGGPVLNQNGEVIGVLSARQTSAEGVVFAIQSKYIYAILSDLKKADTSYSRVRISSNSSLKGMERSQQVKKIEDYVFMVKVN